MTDPCDTKGADALEEEVAYFESKKPELLFSSEGKVALVKGQEILGLFDSEEQAYAAGLARLGNQPFLIRRIAKDDPTASIPALQFGLLRAHS
jgi:hypothetical protein